MSEQTTQIARWHAAQPLTGIETCSIVDGMRSINEHRNQLEGSAYRELRLLEEVLSTPEISQRRLARKLGIALGMANLLLRNLAGKGYVRMTRVGWKRWIYALTPSGMALKVHLTFDYVDRFLNHYRRVRRMLREDLSSLALDEDARVAIYSTSELAELVYLALRDMGIKSIDVFDNGSAGLRFLGMPVRNLDTIDEGKYTLVVVAASGDLDARRRELGAAGVKDSQIVTLMRRGGVPGGGSERDAGPAGRQQ